VMFTCEKLTNSNFCNGVCENSFVDATTIISKEIFLMMQALGIYWQC